MRRSMILMSVLMVLVGAGAGWRRWSENAVALPGIPPSAQGWPCPDGPVKLHVDGTGLPASWRGALAGVDVVVVARLLPDRPEIVDLGHCLMATMYPFGVERVITGTLPSGHLVAVRWPGRPIDEVVDYPHPRASELFVLFLRAVEDGEGYYTPYGPQANLRVVDDRLVPQVERQGSPGPRGSVYEFAAMLRREADVR